MTSILFICLSSLILILMSSARRRACGETLCPDDSYAEVSAPDDPVFWSVQSSSVPVERFPIHSVLRFQTAVPKRFRRGVIPHHRLKRVSRGARAPSDDPSSFPPSVPESHFYFTTLFSNPSTYLLLHFVNNSWDFGINGYKLNEHYRLPHYSFGTLLGQQPGG